MANLFCTQCGGRLTPNAKFCVHCGVPVPMEKIEQILPEPEPVSVQPDLDTCSMQETACDVILTADDPTAETAVKVCDAHAAEEIRDPLFAEVPKAPDLPACEPVQTAVLSAVREQAPAVSDKKTLRPRKRGVFRTILAVFLCISMFTLTCISCSMIGLQSAVSAENLGVLSREMSGELYDLLDILPAAYVLPDVGNDTTLMEYLIELAVTNGMTLSRRGIGDILKSSAFLDTVSNQLILYLYDIRNDTHYAAMNHLDLLDWLRQGSGMISDVLQIEISDDVLTEIAVSVADTGILELTDARLLQRSVPVVYYGIQYVLSARVMCVLMALLLVLAVLLGVADRWSICRMSRDIGITFVVASAAVIVPAVLLPGALAATMMQVPFFGGMLGVWFSYIMENLMFGGVVALVLGVVLIVTSIIAYVIGRRRRKVLVA